MCNIERTGNFDFPFDFVACVLFSACVIIVSVGAFDWDGQGKQQHKMDNSIHGADEYWKRFTKTIYQIFTIK